MSQVFSEISGLSQRDCFYIVERHKKEFTYPLHRHREYELNFIQDAPGVRRIVGDSVETIGEYDLFSSRARIWNTSGSREPARLRTSVRSRSSSLRIFSTAAFWKGTSSRASGKCWTG